MTTSMRKILQKTSNNKRKFDESQTVEKYILPYDLIYEYISTHEVYKYSGTNTRDIYNGINLFLEKSVSTKDDECKTESESTSGKDVINPNCLCFECKAGYCSLDMKEGVYACDKCGVVQSMRSINIVPEYIKPAEIGNVKTKKIKGVSKFVVDMVNAYSDEKEKPNPFLEDLKHFNHWFNIPEDELKFLDNKLQTISKNTSVSYNGKILGVLFAFVLKKSMVKEVDFKSSVVIKKPLPCITAVPEKRFKCKHCDVKCFTMKEARYHCTLLA